MHIKRCLVERYKIADSSPIDYFEFVIDPNSFARTVENMFHMSFLIKEGFANLFQDDVNLPALGKIKYFIKINSHPLFKL